METYEYYFNKFKKFGMYWLSDEVAININQQGVYFYSKHDDFRGEHRLDGPAVIYNTLYINVFGSQQRWVIYNEDKTDEIYVWAIENNIDLNNLSNNDKIMIKLIWG